MTASLTLPRLDDNDVGYYLQYRFGNVTRTFVISYSPFIAVDYDVLGRVVGVELLKTSVLDQVLES